MKNKILDTNSPTAKSQAKIAISYFFLIALLGVLLRWFYVSSISLDYRHIVHAHSHIALLGWVYTGLSSLLYHIFLSKNHKLKSYKHVFWATQLSLIGMLIAFPIQGYALFSIVFSSLFIIISYWFSWLFFTYSSPEQKTTFSYKCIRLALWYMIISNIGPWALGAIMNTLGNTSIWYKIAIYFYLHFQYNGWFFMALLGVFFYILESYQLKIKQKQQVYLHYSLHAGIIFSFFLSVLWTEPNIVFYLLGALGALLLIIALCILFKIARSHSKVLLEKFSSLEIYLLKSVSLLLALKVILQLMSAFSFFASLTYNIPDFVIAYLHMVFLGIVSLSLLTFMSYFKLLNIKKLPISIFLFGFYSSEILIIYKAIALWQGFGLFQHFMIYLLTCSSFMPVGIALILWRRRS